MAVHATGPRYSVYFLLSTFCPVARLTVECQLHRIPFAFENLLVYQNSAARCDQLPWADHLRCKAISYSPSPRGAWEIASRLTAICAAFRAGRATTRMDGPTKSVGSDRRTRLRTGASGDRNERKRGGARCRSDGQGSPRRRGADAIGAGRGSARLEPEAGTVSASTAGTLRAPAVWRDSPASRQERPTWPPSRSRPPLRARSGSRPVRDATRRARGFPASRLLWSQRGGT